MAQPATPRDSLSRVVGLEAVLLLAAAAIAWAVTGRADSIDESALAGALVLTAAFAAVEMLPLHLEWSGQAYSLSLSEVPLVVGLLFWPSLALIGARVLGGAIALVIHRKQPPRKLAFNLVNQTLEAALALAVFLLVPGHAAQDTLYASGAVLAAVVSSTGIAMLCVAAVIRLTVGHVDRAIVNSFARSGLFGLLVNPSLGMVIVAATRQSPFAPIPIVILLLGSGAVYRAYVELRQRHASLETLYRFTRGINHSDTGDGRLREVLVMTRDMLKARRAGVLLDGDGELASIRWVDEDGLMSSEPFQQTRADWAYSLVLTAGTVVRMPRGTRDPGHQVFLTEHGIRDALLAPLRLEGSVRGVLFVQDRRSDVATFTEDDAKLFETVASHAASVLDNSRLVDRLRHESRHDALTGLMNRQYFRSQLHGWLQRPSPRFAVLLADLDRFKEINDTLGHHHGDLLIREVASRISNAAPEGSVVARLGGDEFALLVPADDAVEARTVTQAIRSAVSAPCVLDGLAVDVDASFGITLAPEHGLEETVLLKRADMAMYAAKSSGTAIEVYDRDRDDYSPRRLALATELRAAIEREELVLFFQPQSDVDGTITGVEALVRWEHPTFGQVSPVEFIPLAEHSGAIVELTRWVLARALDQLALWHRRGLPVTMSINVSMRNLLDAGIVDSVRRELRRVHVDPHMVTLEITESHIMSDPGRTLPILHRLAALGVRLSIDDFGTGYSSLSYLRQFPVDEIKIDKSFVSGVATQDNRSIVKAVIAIAEGLDVETVAEGVEDAETAAQLAAMGCTRLQGYYIARPMPPAQLTEWLVEQHLALSSIPHQVGPAVTLSDPRRATG